jgi:HlyD family secretion protein
MRRPTTGLIGFYERLLDRIRFRQPYQPSPPPRPVDLVGSATSSSPEQAQVFGQAPTPTPEPSKGALTNPFQASISRATPTASRPWSFQRTILLNRSQRSSTILVWTAVGSVASVAVWAFTAPLSETIAVRGKLEPGSNTQRIDTPAPGVVEAVTVQEGQQVRKGDPLVRFDLREPRSKLSTATSIRQRLINENQIAQATLGDAAASARLSANQRRQLASQSEELATRIETARQQLLKAQVHLAGNQKDLDTYRNIADRYASLVAQGAASEVQLIQIRQQQDQARNSVAEDQREIARLKAVLANSSAVTSVELRRKIEANLNQIEQSDSDIRLARQQIQYGLLTSPVDGVVFDIEVRPGSVVAQGTGLGADTGSKPLLKVVPLYALQARVYIPNQAVGFVRPGLKADLSIDTYQASDFGYIPAKVISVGSDALTADEQKRVLGTDATGLYFPAALRLERQNVKLISKQVPLQAGMSLTADIKLRERKFINILLNFVENQRRNLERLR